MRNACCTRCAALATFSASRGNFDDRRSVERLVEVIDLVLCLALWVAVGQEAAIKAVGLRCA